jgi:DNA-binding XRE family transcriptional regulator
MTGNDMRAIRKSIALTQHELAERLGVTRKTLIGWEATEGEIDEGVALQVRKVVGAIRLVEHTFWVGPTIRNTYAVVGRRILGMGGQINGATMLYGEFGRRDHAYRWCASLRSSNVDPRITRKLRRERREEQIAREIA